MAEARVADPRRRSTPPPWAPPGSPREGPPGAWGPPAGHGAPAARTPAHRAHPATTVAVAALTAASAAGLARVFAGHRWVAPVALTAACLHLVAWATRRAGWGAWRSAGVQLVALWCVVGWTLVPGALTVGLPLGRALTALDAALQAAVTAFPSTSAPVPATTGFVLMAVVGVGVVALAADWLALRIGSPLQAALPAVALVAVAGAAGTSRGRAWAVGLALAAVAALLAVHTAEVGRGGLHRLATAPPPPPGRPPPARPRRAVPWRAGAAIAATAVVVAAVTTPGSHHPDGHGTLGWKGGGPGGGGGSSRVVLSPVVDLRTRLLQQAGTPVFQVTSPVPSYWRLTSLDTFTGTQWEATASYRAVAGPLPGLRGPAGAATVRATFRIQRLASIWMPTAFTPQAVSGGGRVSWDPVSASLLAGTPTSDGLRYTLTSAQGLAALTPAVLAAVGRPPVDADHARYLRLPADIPASVVQLARSITAGARSEFDAALRLQDYLADGDRFSYSLDPPVDGYGTDALVTFLFTTKTGYCQQFAGAYAVLARAAGLPTRLAVGFTAGTPLGGGRYQVRDADAHTWPEVWFGPSTGWVPFEPTKGDFAIPGAGYAGAASTAPLPAPTPPTTAETQLATPKQLTPSTTAAAATTVAAPAPSATVAGGGSGGTAATVLGIGAAAVAAWVAGVAATRRRRVLRGRRRAGPGAGRVLAAWAEVGEELRWRGLGRRPEETPAEHARRVAPRLTLATGDPSAPERLRRLAAAAAAVAYGPAGAEGGAPTAAALADARQLGRALRRSADRGARLARLLDPRPAG